MRVLIAHGFPERAAFGQAWHEAWVARLQAAGFAVGTLSMALPVPGGRVPWRQLDAMWRRGAQPLLRKYEELAEHADRYDVLVNYGGVNLHPDFLRQLPTLNVLGFFDDPESSAEFSRPVAAAHDLCMVGNIAEIETYRHWGVRAVRWWPLGFREDDYSRGLTRTDILEGSRDIPLTLLCERHSGWRRSRLDRLARAFPDGVFRGSGWPAGFLPEAERVPLLQRTRIGLNIHNSTGPINFRTFYLPANGIMQICDNTRHLGAVFEPGREVVGFDTVDEAIELVRYYSHHDDERRTIAANGWERALREYNESACFQRLLDAVAEVHTTRRSDREFPVRVMLERHRRATRRRRALATVLWPVLTAQYWVGRLVRGGRRRLSRYIDTAGQHAPSSRVGARGTRR